MAGAAAWAGVAAAVILVQGPIAFLAVPELILRQAWGYAKYWRAFAAGVLLAVPLANFVQPADEANGSAWSGDYPIWSLMFFIAFFLSLVKQHDHERRDVAAGRKEHSEAINGGSVSKEHSLWWLGLIAFASFACQSLVMGVAEGARLGGETVHGFRRVVLEQIFPTLAIGIHLLSLGVGLRARAVGAAVLPASLPLGLLIGTAGKAFDPWALVIVNGLAGGGLFYVASWELLNRSFEPDEMAYAASEESPSFLPVRKRWLRFGAVAFGCLLVLLSEIPANSSF